MSHQCCSKNQSNGQYKLRYNPTFVHHQIFYDQPAQGSYTRCTPTFYSTALDTYGYNIKTIHHKNQNHEVEPSKVLHKTVYSNYSHERRIQDLNPRSQVGYSSKDKWYDHTKEQMLATIKNCRHRCCSRQRKQMEQVSDPVFTDFNYQPIEQKITVYKLQEKSPEIEQKLHQQTQPIEKENEASQTQSPFQETEPKRQMQMSSNKDYHKGCIPENEFEKSRTTNLKGKRPSTADKGKKVSFNPTFTVVRDNKIDNHL